jgi:uncharacterized membrane-anchored protein
MRPSAPPSLARAFLVLCVVALFPVRGTAQESGRSIFDVIKWQDGPSTGILGLHADLGVPSYCKFGDSDGAKVFLRATGNIPSGREVGVLLCDPKRDSSYWFVVFDFDESGYVKDDEKATLDAAKILKTLQEGQIQGNAARRRQGLDELEIVGWERPPYYDTVTNNLTWSVRVRSKTDESVSINHSVRLLGRRGVMNVDLVADPEDMATAVVAFDSALTEFSYFSGQSYAEWKPGDKVAEYGLTALVAGGAGLAAAKLGLFGKAWKFLLGVLVALKKFVIVLLLGIAAMFKKIVAFFKREPKDATSSPTGTPTGTPPVRAPSGAYKTKPPVKPPVAAGAPAASGPPATPETPSQ